MTCRRFVSTLVLLLSSVSTVSAADQQPRNQIEIDRSVLQDLQGYEPPAMFGASAQKVTTAPLKRVAVPPQAPTLTTLKAEDVLEFPVKNSEVVTRQRMTAPEEKVASARPDYSDSHTLLNPPHAHDTKTKATPAKKTLVKAPLPPKKPSVQLVAASSDDAVNFPLQKNTPAKKVAPKAEQKVTIAATPMKPAPAAPKYVPKSRPSMPAVPSGNVEKASLDPFALPTDADDSVEIKKPTPGERMIDQALSNHMIEPSTADIEATMSGGKATSTKPFEMAALPPAAGTPVPIISMEYLPRLSALQTDQRNTLKTEVVSFLQKKTDARLQIQAFADGKGNDSDARQLSLSRALEIRAFLLDSGIDPSRIDVRALGSNTTEKPIDRVDLKFTRQN